MLTGEGSWIDADHLRFTARSDRGECTADARNGVVTCDDNEAFSTWQQRKEFRDAVLDCYWAGKRELARARRRSK